MGRLKMEQGNKERMFLMRREDLASIFDLFCFFVFFPPQTQNTVYEIVSEMNTRQDVMEERLSTLEEKLTLLQETLEALPEAISRYLPMVNNPPSFQQQASAEATSNNTNELQRRQQFLHPESTYGSRGSADGGGSGGGVTHSRSSPGTWTASATSTTAAAAPTSSGTLPVPAQPPQPSPLPSKPKLS